MFDPAPSPQSVFLSLDLTALPGWLHPSGHSQRREWIPVLLRLCGGSLEHQKQGFQLGFCFKIRVIVTSRFCLICFPANTVVLLWPPLQRFPFSIRFLSLSLSINLTLTCKCNISTEVLSNKYINELMLNHSKYYLLLQS